MSFQRARKELGRFANPEKAKFLQRFFKTGKGEYAENDKFIGVVVPQTRLVSRQFQELGFTDLQKLLKSKIHEERLLALLILVRQFQKSDRVMKKKVYAFYLRHIRFINNWDLVDLSSHQIVGAYLEDKNRAILYKLVKSPHLWDRRIAMVSTYSFIRGRDYKDTLKLAEALLGDKEDLLHKAAGWMLREVGKRDEKVLEKFLSEFCARMPRTMLRYSIERLSESKRRYYMNGGSTQSRRSIKKLRKLP